jgi:hypothetical protein
MWRNQPKHGFINANEAIKELLPLRDLLLHLLRNYSSASSLPIIKTQTVLQPAGVFIGRQHLRSILSEATATIFVRDNYLKSDILDALHEFLIAKPLIKVNLLVLETKELFPLKINFDLLNRAYPNRVELRYLSHTQKDHPRYILVDDKMVFNPDHSLDQWGIATVNIHRFEDSIEIDKVRNMLQAEWSSAQIP